VAIYTQAVGANKVAEEVIERPRLLNKLVNGLNEPDDVIRARTAHALERIPRAYQGISQGLVPQFINVVQGEQIDARWLVQVGGLQDSVNRSNEMQA